MIKIVSSAMAWLVTIAANWVKNFGSVFIILLSTPLLASELSTNQLDRIADSVYVAEGGKKARVPYGIISVAVRDEKEARQVCIQSIKNNYSRWQKAGKPGDFFFFMARRYCPPSPQTWASNVKTILGKEFVDGLANKKKD
jgi:hypothetical protein